MMQSCYAVCHVNSSLRWVGTAGEPGTSLRDRQVAMLAMPRLQPAGARIPRVVGSARSLVRLTKLTKKSGYLANSMRPGEEHGAHPTTGNPQLPLDQDA